MAATWKAWREDGSGPKGSLKKPSTLGDFDVVTVKKAPPVVFDQPTKGKGGTSQGVAQGSTQGEGEEEVVEKTFFQK